jgi:hypothetical protein
MCDALPPQGAENYAWYSATRDRGEADELAKLVEKYIKPTQKLAAVDEMSVTENLAISRSPIHIAGAFARRTRPKSSTASCTAAGSSRRSLPAQLLCCACHSRRDQRGVELRARMRRQLTGLTQGELLERSTRGLALDDVHQHTSRASKEMQQFSCESLAVPSTVAVSGDKGWMPSGCR